MALYFTRRNREAAQRLWGELLRLTLAAAGPASTAPQLYFLSDLTTAAVLQRYPEDRVRACLPVPACLLLALACAGGGGAWQGRSARCGLRPAAAAAAVCVCTAPPIAHSAVTSSPFPCAPPGLQVGFHPYGALLRLCKLCPVGKWRALREALLALEKQKAAFAAAEGPFLYLAAAATAEVGARAACWRPLRRRALAGAAARVAALQPTACSSLPACLICALQEFRGAGLGSMLLDRCCREADAQRRCLYVDVSSDQARAFFR